ncbi:MAG: gamma-glutamyl-gamma-aminobutyrate hydrolase family protein [Alkalispirochaeta sp.]
MRIDVLQHVSYEGPAGIARILEEGGHVIRVTHLYAGDPPPDAAEISALVVMGGPMSVHDTGDYPWLSDEIALIRNVVDRAVPVLGICLGAQLIAMALGARVYRGERKEIGWFPVSIPREEPISRLTADWPEEAHVLHWHGDTFDLPRGARLLAGSQAYPHQAFEVYGYVVGIQFHLEMMDRNVREIVENSRNELVPGAFVQSEEEILRGVGRSEVPLVMLRGLLGRWVTSATQEIAGRTPRGGSDE